MIERSCGHHPPDHMRGVGQAITAIQPRNVSVVEPEKRSQRQQKSWLYGGPTDVKLGGVDKI